MAELSKIRKNGVDYDIKDATAREAIEKLKQNGTGDGSGGNVDCILPVDFSGVTVHSVNHRGYSSAAPENTIPAYIMSKEKGFVCVEADVAFTSDGVAVLLHDNTIDRTSNGSGRISALTFAEVSKYDFGSWKSATYTGTRIPTFAEFIAFCKNVGLHPYIELKNAATYTAAQIRSLGEMVNNCGMRGKVSWISFTATYLGYVRDADPTARLGYLVSSINTTAISTAKTLQTGRNEVFMDSSDYDANAIALCQAARLPLEIWTINNQSIIKNMDSYITGVTSDSLIAENILREKAMNYEYGIVGVTLSSISATYSGGSVSVGTNVSALTGVVVTAHYSDGSTTTVTGYTLSGAISEGSNVITVSYGGMTTTFTVVGVAEDEVITLTGISANYSGGDVAVGTNVNSLTGVVVTAHYSNGSTVTVTGYTLSGTITEGSNTVTVSYGGKTTTFTVNGVTSSTSEWTAGKFYLPLVQGSIFDTASSGYIKDSANRVSYVGTDCTLTPGKIYRLIGVDGVRYGIHTILESGYNKIQNGQDVTSSQASNGADKLDSGWQSSGYEFVADDAAVCAWVTASFTSGNITPEQAMPVYLEEVDSGADDPDYNPNVALNRISATYSGGNVAVGTAVTALTGILVTAHYSDGTTAPVTGYALSGTIAEGTNTVTVSYGGKTTTFSVTGVAESGGSGEEDIIPNAVVNLAFANEAENVIPNIGTGGTQYDATVVDYIGSHESSGDGLVLNGHAYANVNYALSKTTPFTVCVKGAFTTLNSNKYQRLMRTNTDAPCVFHSNETSQNHTCAKLTGVSGSVTTVSPNAILPHSTSSRTCNYDNTVIDNTTDHTYVFVGDVASGLVSYYLDGELFATQPISGLSATTLIGMGDNDQTKSYYADTITITDFRIWSTALSAEQVATL